MSDLYMPNDLKDELLAIGTAKCDAEEGRSPYLHYYWIDASIIDRRIYPSVSVPHFVYVARLNWRRQTHAQFVEDRT